MVALLRSDRVFMKRLYIAGAGGFGREVYSWLKQTADWKVEWAFAGFLDDNRAALDRFAINPGIVGAIHEFVPVACDAIVCAIGDPRIRLKVCRTWQAQGAVFPIVRHPFSVVGDDCRIGDGSILCPGAILTTNIDVGRYVIVNLHATIGHDAKVGDGVTLSPHADVTGFAQIGEGAFLGSHASVLPGAKVGDFAKVGAGSVVLRTVAAGATVIGVPAKQILP
jgi:sugar O-acyltransferase (sialic acid O-acetyltransferase NeuD family)